MSKKSLASQLEKFQIDFITNKVKELGGYKEACGFYSKKDVVCAFAKQVAAEIYDVIEDDEPSMEYAQKEVPAPAPKEKKKAEMVKKKRKRVVVTDEE